MTEAVKLFIQEMDKRDVRHQEVFEAQGRTVVPIGFGIKSTNITIHVIFDDNDYTVAIRCFGFLKISEDQFPQALVCCNELNFIAPTPHKLSVDSPLRPKPKQAPPHALNCIYR